jgi:hypothetical protein
MMGGYYNDPSTLPYNQTPTSVTQKYQGINLQGTPTDQTAQQSSTGQQQATTPAQQQTQQLQQQQYPTAVPPAPYGSYYHPHFYMANQFPQNMGYPSSGYGQHFVNKSMYPAYGGPSGAGTGAITGTGQGGSKQQQQTSNLGGYGSYSTGQPHMYHQGGMGYDDLSGAGLGGVTAGGAQDYGKAGSTGYGIGGGQQSHYGGGFQGLGLGSQSTQGQQGQQVQGIQSSQAQGLQNKGPNNQGVQVC